MNKKLVLSANAPSPIGPYSQAIESNGLLFISGQIALDPISGELLIADIQTETHQVLKNIKAILNERELTFDHVLKASVFVKNMDDFSKINEVYTQYFTGNVPPARELVAVSALPKYVNVEISVIATTN